jgi:ribosomal protein S18 acetylase RimI-like enzyme
VGEQDKFIYQIEVDGKPAGSVMFRIVEDGSRAFIHDFYIVPGQRRKGFGTTMIDRLLSRLGELGVKRVDLHVTLGNSPALEFWQEQGFKIIQYRLMQRLAGGRRRDLAS